MLSDLWDNIVDGFDYFIHFEWVGDAKDSIVDTFSNMGEFSAYGFIFGLLGCGFILLTKQWMLDSFTKYMKAGTGILITVMTFVLTFVVCYLIGKRFEDTA